MHLHPGKGGIALRDAEIEVLEHELNVQVDDEGASGWQIEGVGEVW